MRLPKPDFAALIQNAVQTIRSNLRKAIIIAVLVVCTIAGAITAYLMYRAAQPEYFLAKLDEAIKTSNGENLQKLVDFEAIATGILEAAIPALQLPTETEDARQQQLVGIRHALLEALAPGSAPASGGEGGEGAEKAEGKKEEGKKKGKGPVYPQQSPHAAVIPGPMPEGLQAQLAAAPFTMIGRDGNLAVIGSTATHEKLGITFPIKLVIRKQDTGWRAISLANVEQVAGLYAAEVAAIKAKAATELAAVNAEIATRIAGHARIIQASAGVSTLSNGRDKILVLHMTGDNPGPVAVNSMGLALTLSNAQGQVLRTFRLFRSEPVMPLNTFTFAWSVDLDPEKSPDKILLAAGPVELQVEIRSVTLANGNVIVMQVP